MAGAHLGARLSFPIDTLVPYLLYAGPAAYQVLDLLTTWGVNHLSVGVCVEEAETFVRGAHDRGWPVDIWDVENEDDLERALLMGPESITADLGAINHLPQSKQTTARPSIGAVRDINW